MTSLLLSAVIFQSYPSLNVSYGALSSKTDHYSATARFAKFRYPPPRVTVSDYSKVMFDDYLTKQSQDHASKGFNGFVKEANQFFADPLSKDAADWLYDEAVHVGIARSGLASYYVVTETYTGGAHANREYQGFTFIQFESDPRPLKLSDLVVGNAAEIRKKISGVVLPKLRAMGASSVQSGGITELTDAQCANFVMTPFGVTWMLSPYEVGSYAEGEYFVKVPWSELRTIFQRTPLLSPITESGLGD